MDSYSFTGSNPFSLIVLVDFLFFMIKKDIKYLTVVYIFYLITFSAEVLKLL